jgi:NADH-quinone oxidoreductase subunit J
VTAVFFIAALITLVTTALAITRANPVHGLLNFVASLLSMAVIFFTLGAPFAAALEVMVYAGAVVVLFLFVVMMLTLDKRAAIREREWMARPVWVLPALFVAVLGGLLARIMFFSPGDDVTPVVIPPQAVGARLFSVEIGAVELASMLLLAGLIGAFHMGRK